MSYCKFNFMTELSKLSRGKKTIAEPFIIAKLALERIRDLERDEALEELERLFDLPDTRR